MQILKNTDWTNSAECRIFVIFETLKIFDMVTAYIKPGLSEKDIADYVCENKAGYDA